MIKNKINKRPPVKIKFLINQRGFVATLIVFFILLIMLSVTLSMGLIVFNRQKNTNDIIRSTQAYYAAESGIEDSLLRLNNNFQMSPLSYSININNTTANVVIPGIIGGSRSIISQGNNNGIIKTTQVVYAIDSQEVSFHYGAQVGPGGLSLGSNSEIQGNVLVDGNITGSGSITGDVIVSGNGNSIKDSNVGGNVLAYSCLSNATVAGDLTYVTGGTYTCEVNGTTSSQSSAIAPQPLPISQSQIDDWKDETANGTPKSAYTINSNQTVTENSSVVITGNMSVESNATWDLMGFTKIIGDLTIGSNSNVNISGTLYVTGTIGFDSNSITQLSSSYGSQSGIILSDGVITVNSDAILRGSGQTGSYILILSTSSSSSAIGIASNSTGVIFYTSAGGIQINSNANVREVTGYKVSLGSNAILQYESGLANLFFTGGPGGSWKVTSWEEK